MGDTSTSTSPTASPFRAQPDSTALRYAPFVGVHIGAGNFSIKREPAYCQLLQAACDAAYDALAAGLPSSEAVTKAIQLLEDSKLVNAGSGSNLTTDARVECDATLAYTRPSGRPSYGAVGCISGIRNPIIVASKLAQASSVELVENGRVPPRFLVGLGAACWAQANGCEVVEAQEQACERARKQLAYYQSRVGEKDGGAGRGGDVPVDTVGAVCLDQFGEVSAGASSGGLLLKTPGRVGPAASVRSDYIYQLECYSD